MKADDELDLFGDDDDETAEDLKKIAEKSKEGAKKKKVVIAKSIVIFDVKVWEIETDLDALATKIIKHFQLNGLVWGQ